MGRGATNRLDMALPNEPARRARNHRRSGYELTVIVSGGALKRKQAGEKRATQARVY
jgi:hypothetical protein